MNQSQELNELAAALSIAQGQFEGAKKDSSNPFFKSKYADLESVWDAIRKPLSQNGLSVIQMTHFIDGAPFVATRIMHKSGQWIEGLYPIITKDQADPQKFGAGLTYARRFSLSAAVGIYQVDDDGNELSKHGESKLSHSKDNSFPTVIPGKENNPHVEDEDYIIETTHLKGMIMGQTSDIEIKKAWQSLYEQVHEHNHKPTEQEQIFVTRAQRYLAKKAKERAK